MIQIAVVGVGGWGKNLVRNFEQIPTAHLRYICDIDEEVLHKGHRFGPSARITTRFEEVLDDPQLDAVVVATPGETHYKLCKEALEAGKDVYVEKPFVLHAEEAEQLIAMAEDTGRILMVGHLLLYHPVVEYLADAIAAGELGRVYYIYSQRLNLGRVRGDENAMWNFAPHDVSVILHLLGKAPVSVSARGQSYLQSGIEDVVFMNLYFEDRSMANVHVSWLDPHKVRKMTVVGSKKMAVFDDLEANEKLRLYDKGAQFNDEYETFAEYIGLRFGDITIPHIKMIEPLQIECNHFLHCVETRSEPRTGGADGLRVVRVLSAAQQSLEQDGAPISLSRQPVAQPSFLRSSRRETAR